MRSARFPTVRNAAPLLLGAFCLVLWVVDASSAPEVDGPKPEIITLLNEFNGAPDPGNWINENQSRLSQPMLDEIQRHAQKFLEAGALRTGSSAYALLSQAYLAKGERRKSFEKYVDTWGIELLLAESQDEYEQVYESARKASLVDDQDATPEVRFKASVTATEACYFAANSSADQRTRRVWEARGLDGLVESARLADHASQVTFEKLVSVSVVILRDALDWLSYGGNIEHRATRLKELAPLLERSVPVGFVYRHLPGKAPADALGVAYTLAELSNYYGSAEVAVARLRDVQ